jgi:hypothetical protein
LLSFETNVKTRKILAVGALITSGVFLSGCSSQSIASLEEVKTVCRELSGQDLNDSDKSKILLSDLGPQLAVVRANDPEEAGDLLSLVDQVDEQVKFIQDKATQLSLELALNKDSSIETIEEMNEAHSLIEGLENEIETFCTPFLKK